MAVVRGIFRGRVWSNWHTQYHILTFETDNKKTIQVILRTNENPDMNNQEYFLQGSWSKSECYGWQFYITKIETATDYAEKHQRNIKQIQSELAL